MGELSLDSPLRIPPLLAARTDAAADMLATLREGLSNVARHAQANRADVVVAVDVGEPLLLVTDDRIGPPAPGQPRGNGLDNMAERTRRRGSFTIGPATPKGAQVAWRVPMK